MSGGACVVIIDGNGVQGASYELISTASASCQLVDYLEHDENLEFNDDDTKPIQDFHHKAEKVLRELNAELDGLNHALARKYNR